MNGFMEEFEISDSDDEYFLSDFEEELRTLEDEAEAEYQRVLTNKIKYFEPFEYQKKFMEAGSKYRLRFLRAANRIGKSYGTSAEMTYHLTGDYPDWWKGKRITKGGLTYWCIGITLDSVRKVLQKELLGTNDCRIKRDIGTGFIPRENIELKQGYITDGARLQECKIKHSSGDFNTLMFYSAENVLALAGQSVAGIWLDEEPLKSIDLYDQCKMRLANALGKGENGFFMFTATPEVGQTPLNDLFEENEGGVFYLQSATWWDCPLWDEKRIEEELAATPEWKREMRSKGIPVRGSGTVFQVNLSAVIRQHINPLPHWKVIAGVDWGAINDPTVFNVSAIDPNTGTFHCIDEWVLGEKGDSNEEIRSPQYLANLIMNSQYRGIPVVIPHDSGLASEANETKGKILQRLGVNVVGTFRNPLESQMNGKNKLSFTNKSTFSIEAGLEEMRYLFQQGKLLISENCLGLIKELPNYYYKVNPITGRKKYSGSDHSIDAARYALMSLVCNRGCNWGDVQTGISTEFQSIETIQFN